MAPLQLSQRLLARQDPFTASFIDMQWKLQNKHHISESKAVIHTVLRDIMSGESKTKLTPGDVYEYCE